MPSKYARLKYSCYSTNLTMSVVANISPILFLTFRSQYNISYSLLGLLVLINFCTQLAVDLIFSFFSHKFNIPKTVKIIPIIAAAGMALYAILPQMFSGFEYPLREPLCRGRRSRCQDPGAGARGLPLP